MHAGAKDVKISMAGRKVTLINLVAHAIVRVRVYPTSFTKLA